MNVMALLPYLVMNYEDANELCITSAKNIAHVSTEKSKKLENLSTVMTLYSRRTFRYVVTSTCSFSSKLFLVVSFCTS
jgi:hypothetical protein